MMRSVAVIAAVATVVAASPPVTFSVPQFQSATPEQRIALVLAALPPSAGKLSARDVALPPFLDIAADADGWFAKVEVYLVPTWVSASSLCERRLIASRLRPTVLEYPMQQTTVSTRPLRPYAVSVLRGYLRLGNYTGSNSCPSHRNAGYTFSNDAATASKVFDGLDDAITRRSRGDPAPRIDCELRDGVQPCADDLMRLRAVASRIDSIYTERGSPDDTGEQIYRASGATWTAQMRFQGRQVTDVVLYLTPPPPVE